MAIEKQAEILGQEAFKKGQERIINNECRKLLTGLSPGKGGIKIMKAFYKGWDKENLKFLQ